MCGRFVSSSSSDEIARYFGAEEVGESALEPDYNVAPTRDVFAVLESGSMRRVETLHWGLVPFWAKDVKIGNRMINARAETVADKNAFRSAFRKRRCIIPADGFYEWTVRAGQQKKQPYYVHRPDDEPFAFAGLWEVWRGPERDRDEALHSCTIITTDANDVMAEIHDRMPVILPPSAWSTWLDRDQDDVETLGRLLVPAPDEVLTVHPVSTEVNNARNAGAHLIDPIDLTASDGGG
jgi:putative SOS response-associated peptidase YedK